LRENTDECLSKGRKTGTIVRPEDKRGCNIAELLKKEVKPVVAEERKKGGWFSGFAGQYHWKNL